MTKKHMEWTAQYIGIVLEQAEVDGAVRLAIAMFSHFNPLFDEARFRAAVVKYSEARGA